MTAPPAPTTSDSEDKCPICGKPLSTHTYEEQVACTAKKAALDAEHYKKLNDDIDKAETKEAD